MARLERAFAATPADGAGLAALVTELRTRGALDPALERVVVHGESGGAADDVHRLVGDLDPWIAAKGSHLVEAGVACAEAARSCAARELWACAWALGDGAEALWDGARSEVGERRAAALLGTIAEDFSAWRRSLLSRREVTAALAAAGAPLSADQRPVSRLVRDRDALRDARSPDVQVSSGRWARVEGPVGARVLRLAAQVFDSAYNHARESYAAHPLARDGALRIEIVSDVHGFRSRLDRLPDPSPFAGEAHRDPEDGHLVVRDPRLDGADLGRLWQVLAREAARTVLDERLGADPTWLTAGLAVRSEAIEVLPDESVRIGDLPHHRLAEVLASMSGWGAARPTLGALLERGAALDGGPAWSWSLVHFVLHEALDEDPLDALLEVGRTNPPADTLRDVVLTRYGAGGRDPWHVFERAWGAWLDAEAALARGLPGALDERVARARRALRGHDLSAARRLVGQVRRVEAGHPGALAAAVEIAERSGDRDSALLAARWLAAGRETGDAAARHSEAAAVHAGLADVLVEVEQLVRHRTLELAGDLERDAWPLAALRLVDRALAASPLDVALRERRAALAEVVGAEAARTRLRPPALDDLAGLHGELDLWSADGRALAVLAVDRIDSTTLRGVARLTPPCTLTARLRFLTGDDDRLRDDGRRHLGLLLGGQEAVDHGAWGLLVSPSGTVSLAHRGGLEWPAVPIAQARRRLVDLSLRLDDRGITVEIDGNRRVRLDRGSRPVAGWLSLYARRVDGAIEDLAIWRSRQPDPATVWFTAGR